jgi:hypothetical protein
VRDFLRRHEEQLDSVLGEFGVVGADARKFKTVCAFLSNNPESLSWRGNKPILNTVEGFRRLGVKFYGARNKKDMPSAPSTVPDEAVSIVMRAVYGYEESSTSRIKLEHQHAMSAENIVGALLERYIAFSLEGHGWVWCAGDFVKAVDFIKYNDKDGTWSAVQVKNRDNTENSSSSSVRGGTEIVKWFRTYSRTGLDNWSNFPESEFRSILSEVGFRAFIAEYFK